MGVDENGADENGAILEAVRVVLGPAGLVLASTGRLLRVGELSQTLGHSLLHDHEVDYSIRSARVVRADAASATVALDASIETAATTVDGRTVRSSTKAQGPLLLVREGDGWKVTDMTVGEVSLLARCFEDGFAGSSGGLTVTILGGRVFETFVWLYLEVANEAGRPVKVERLAVGNRRSLLPGWRWASGQLPVEVLEPGTTRLDCSAALRHAHAAKGARLLLRTDAGLVDARPASVRRPRRRIPLSMRYPWALSSAFVAVLVVALGSLLSWWAAGLLLIQVAAVTLLSFQGHIRKGVPRGVLLRFGWVLAGGIAGLALFFANGGLGGFRGESERHRVTAYVADVTGSDVVRADRVAQRRLGACHWGFWDVRTERSRYWVVASRGSRGLSVTPYPHAHFESAQQLVSATLAAQRAVSAQLVKLLGKQGKSLAPECF